MDSQLKPENFVFSTAAPPIRTSIIPPLAGTDPAKCQGLLPPPAVFTPPHPQGLCASRPLLSLKCSFDSTFVQRVCFCMHEFFGANSNGIRFGCRRTLFASRRNLFPAQGEPPSEEVCGISFSAGCSTDLRTFSSQTFLFL